MAYLKQLGLSKSEKEGGCNWSVKFNWRVLSEGKEFDLHVHVETHRFQDDHQREAT